ncbi:hypothetical protein A2303_05160 [Candidatus Falkowbacteria bacterium RIFOXYB2_FULL_47_14]|uniref:Nudix hydrolase domain-containing protein n=1 Tax=Candidatus Falkowbacteria bacterium RIFOXYA2_FULL_47_19 TaxID=1797994 RepID=A0A1F5SJA3_9BACT|nr:MAG: hypothetical protein A2227_06540 [Candidatus Falkowbacteria bacterium RIFOXYA2_FULL_47_19]OGF35747.1 MAG: hypothetical protein A2468_05215 [Candidatus Falkowbacteria bacterium RIFOXYC2_FULL_46_15]OGF43305.1 MAG: hypothetical protein A2303_05160 [Candidatus Falkowbacteria bacterium RIFOXYB2_FULL_47_14]
MNDKKLHIEVFFYGRTKAGEIRFLLLKRVPERGGFWQPLTGGVEAGENDQEAIKREIREETGMEEIKQIIDSGYEFEFSDKNGNFKERVYGAEIALDAKVILSHEHSEMKWVSKDEVPAMLKWPNNIEGFKRVCRELGI